MKYIWLVLLVWLGDNSALDRVSRFNAARRQAERTYTAGQYRQAIGQYNYLINNAVSDAATHLNLGHAYFHLSQFSAAKAQYKTIRPDQNPDLGERAAVQLGIIACHQRDSALALAFFKQALLHNPDNEAARYDFELIKRTWSGRQQGRSNQAKPQQQLQPTTGNNVVKSARKEQILHRIGPAGLTDEQALQLLDALPDESLTIPAATARVTETGNRW
jgi:tetratricopeptide (TPR) repeat protein